MLLSSGGFAVYLTESKVFDQVFPQFGNLGEARNRRKVLALWLKSKLFALSGLDRELIANKILAECRHGGDFLRIVMEEIARKQRVVRWADNTPEHVLYLPTILKELPGVRVIHMIRDGRDVAVSLEKKGWVRPFPWDRDCRSLVAGLYWEWMVEKGRACKKMNGHGYMEIRYEELTSRPAETLEKIGNFIEHDLDYQRIQQVGIGSVNEPNTSFESEIESSSFQPVGRWRSALAAEQIAALEALIGPTLRDLGYPLSAPNGSSSHVPRRMRRVYHSFWDAKLWLKTKTPLGRVFAKTSAKEL